MKKIILTFVLFTLLAPAFAGRCGQAWNCCVGKPGMRVAGGSSCVGYDDENGERKWIPHLSTCVWVDCGEML